jgi:hypothetical protein
VVIVKNNHLADWKLVCSPRDQGGLGVLDLHKMNEALLAKWIWNLENSNGLWQTIIRHKCVKGRPIISVRKKQSDSHFWKGILAVRDNFFKYCKKELAMERIQASGIISGVIQNRWRPNILTCLRLLMIKRSQ